LWKEVPGEERRRSDPVCISLRVKDGVWWESRNREGMLKQLTEELDGGKKKFGYNNNGFIG
jgi:hypothetical protein